MATTFQEKASRITTNIKENWKRLRHRFYVYLTFILLLTVVICAYFFNLIFINIYPGEKGVYWQRFHGGTDREYIYNEGMHIIPPWNRMYIYNTRIQHKPFQFEALSKDGLRIGFEVSVRYFPEPQFLPELHTTVGPDYVEKVVLPEVQANVRKVVANYLPEEIYTSEGYLLQIIMQGALGALAERHINLDDLLIRRMILPQTIVEAIERKLSQQQQVLEYEYRLQKETKEAQRKAIEAGGIKQFQDIVKSSDFFDKYLQYKGIDATVDLAKSNNSKVVVIGGGKGNLPLIMNMDGTPAVTQAPPTATMNVEKQNHATSVSDQLPKNNNDRTVEDQATGISGEKNTDKSKTISRSAPPEPASKE